MNQTETPKISDSEAEVIYALGYNAYEHGHYAKAATIFNGLAISMKENSKYWMGLGSAQQMLKKYEQAVQAFLFAAALQPKEPEAFARAAECLWHLGKVEQALFTLDTAQTIANQNKIRHEQLLDQLELYKQAWSTAKKNRETHL